MTNKILTTCAALLLAGSIHAADNTTTHTTTPFNGSIVNPCTGQPIQFFGTCHYTIKEQTTNDGVSRTREHLVCEGHGITPTGTIHRVLINNKDSVRIDACDQDFVTHETLKLISFGKEPNYFLDSQIVMETNNQCMPDLTIVQDAECRGAGQ